MVRIIMKNPDGTCCGRPEDIFIKRNGQSESFYRMLEEEGKLCAAAKTEPSGRERQNAGMPSPGKKEFCRKMRNQNG